MKRTIVGWIDEADYYSVYIRDMPAETPGYFPSNAQSTKLDAITEGLGRRRVRVSLETLDEEPGDVAVEQDGTRSHDESGHGWGTNVSESGRPQRDSNPRTRDENPKPKKQRTRMVPCPYRACGCLVPAAETDPVQPDTSKVEDVGASLGHTRVFEVVMNVYLPQGQSIGGWWLANVHQLPCTPTLICHRLLRKIDFDTEATPTPPTVRTQGEP